MAEIKRGMILAAGLGKRLLPITETLPKPLIPVLNIPNILFNIFLLKNAGIKDIIINLHHLQKKVEEFLGDGERWGVQLKYSKEKDLLGTGGGIKRAEPFFQEKPFVVANCDLITNLNLSAYIKNHFKRKALATMILVHNPSVQDRYSKVGTNAKSNLCFLPGAELEKPEKYGIYTGVQILDPQCLNYLEDRPSGLTETLYKELLKEKPTKAFGEYAKNTEWYDTGDFVGIWETSMQLLQSSNEKNSFAKDLLKNYLEYEETKPGVWISSGEKIPSHVEIIPPVILGKAQLQSDIQLGPNVVIGDGVKIGKNSKIKNAVVLTEAQLSGNFQTENTIVFGKGQIKSGRS